MSGTSSRRRFVVHHSNWLQPEDLLRFVHFGGFTADWNEIGLSDDDLSLLQIQIMLAPTAGPVIAGTGGLRKLRFSPPGWKRGKRGAVRVLYAIFPDYSVAVLAAAYAKNDREDLTAREKRELAKILKEIGEILEKGSSETQLN